jgi:hypothetical protein
MSVAVLFSHFQERDRDWNEEVWNESDKLRKAIQKRDIPRNLGQSRGRRSTGIVFGEFFRMKMRRVGGCRMRCGG